MTSHTKFSHDLSLNTWYNKTPFLLLATADKCDACHSVNRVSDFFENCKTTRKSICDRQCFLPQILNICSTIILPSLFHIFLLHYHEEYSLLLVFSSFLSLCTFCITIYANLPPYHSYLIMLWRSIAESSIPSSLNQNASSRNMIAPHVAE